MGRKNRKENVVDPKDKREKSNYVMGIIIFIIAILGFLGYTNIDSINEFIFGKAPDSLKIELYETSCKLKTMGSIEDGSKLFNVLPSVLDVIIPKTSTDMEKMEYIVVKDNHIEKYDFVDNIVAVLDDTEYNVKAKENLDIISNCESSYDQLKGEKEKISILYSSFDDTNMNLPIAHILIKDKLGNSQLFTLLYYPNKNMTTFSSVIDEETTITLMYQEYDVMILKDNDIYYKEIASKYLQNTKNNKYSRFNNIGEFTTEIDRQRKMIYDKTNQ